MSRVEILGLYKSLLRTAGRVFRGDAPTHSAAVGEIRREFRAPQEDVSDAFQGGLEAEIVLRKGVLQLEQSPEEPTTFKANIRPEFELEENVAFKADISPEEYQKSIRAAKKKKKKTKTTTS